MIISFNCYFDLERKILISQRAHISNPLLNKIYKHKKMGLLLFRSQRISASVLSSQLSLFSMTEKKCAQTNRKKTARLELAITNVDWITTRWCTLTRRIYWVISQECRIKCHLCGTHAHISVLKRNVCWWFLWIWGKQLKKCLKFSSVQLYTPNWLFFDHSRFERLKGHGNFLQSFSKISLKCALKHEFFNYADLVRLLLIQNQKT